MKNSLCTISDSGTDRIKSLPCREFISVFNEHPEGLTMEILFYPIYPGKIQNKFENAGRTNSDYFIEAYQNIDFLQKF